MYSAVSIIIYTFLAFRLASTIAWQSSTVMAIGMVHAVCLLALRDAKLCCLDTRSRYPLSQRRRLPPEATLQQYLPLGKQTLLGVGANGFYYRQVTGDSGAGAVIGPNEGTDIGVGPVFTLIHKAAKYNSRPK